MAENTTVKVTLSLFGETREIETEGRDWLSDREPEKLGTVWRAAVGGLVGQIGRGSARYPTTLLLNRLYDGESARNRGTVVTDQEGRVWTYHLGTCIRNRQARIVAWADRAPATNYSDQTRTS